MHERRSFTRLPRLAFGWGALLVVAATLAGCDSSGADEEGEVITRIELRLQNADTGQVIAASVQGGDGLTAGAVVQADSLLLQAGSVYDGRIDLFNAPGSNITTQVRQGAEDYQLFYTVEGADGVVAQVTDLESDYGTNDFGDDLPVGLTVEVTVSEAVATQGDLRVQVGAFGPGRKNGRTLTVEPVVDVRLPLRTEVVVSGPGAMEFITRAVLRLARTDGAESWTATAISPGGLSLGENSVPDLLEISACATEAGGTTTCTEENAIYLFEGAYEGQWDLFDETAGIQLNDEIIAEADWHQVFYNINASVGDPFTFLDLDSNGLPLGLSYSLSIARTLAVGGNFGVNLMHYDPARGEVKDGQRVSLGSDMSFGMPLQVSGVGLPEIITRTVLTLQRADTTETITLTAVRDEGLRLEGAEPDSLAVETCTGPPGQQNCTTGRTLALARGATYTGSVELFNDGTGEPVMEEIMDVSGFHQFFFLRDLAEAFTITDTDEVGLPLGFNFQLDVPAEARIDEGLLQIILGHYGRGVVKNGVALSQKFDLDFSVMLSVP